MLKYQTCVSTLKRWLSIRSALGVLAAILISFSAFAGNDTSQYCSTPDDSIVAGSLTIGENISAPLVTPISSSELYVHQNVQYEVGSSSSGALKVEFTSTSSSGSVVLFCGCGAGCGGQCSTAVTSDTAFCQGGCYKDDGSACTSCTWRKLDAIVSP